MTATGTTTVVGYLRTPGQNGTSGWRLGVLALGMVSLGFVLIWRLAMLQVVEPESYVQHGESQRMRSSPLPAERGGIFDRNEVELAVSTPRPSIYADPRLFTRQEDVARAAASIVAITGGDQERLARRLSNGEAKFAWMARQLDEETAAAVMALELPGIYSLEEQARITPSGGVARGFLVGSTSRVKRSPGSKPNTTNCSLESTDARLSSADSCRAMGSQSRSLTVATS